jgi:hypothetical protein
MKQEEFFEKANQLIKENNNKFIWVFRGLKVPKYNCTTSFTRFLKKSKVNNINFISKNHSILVSKIRMILGNNYDDKRIWSHVQHYHEMTNLLDVTTSPEIAWHFASNLLNKKENTNSPNECRIWSCL